VLITTFDEVTAAVHWCYYNYSVFDYTSPIDIRSSTAGY
jgi:hypothetical protein